MIHPVILCGGAGSRLWPLSREGFPKQFAALTGDLSLFQQCARRLSGASFAAPVVVTRTPFRFIVAEQLAAAGIEPAAILIEPGARDTAPAALAAVMHVAASDPEGMVLIAPSDHHIPDAAGFRAAVGAGLEAAAQGDIVTFGVTPDRAETGYGYLELTGEPASGGARRLQRFVEKPDRARAEEMLASGRYLWNAGIFLGRSSGLLAAYRAHAPELMAPVGMAVAAARADLGFLRLDPAVWDKVRSVSIDYAVMERMANLSVVPWDGVWSDLGDWDAIWRTATRDDDGVAASAGATAVGCRDTLLRVEGGGIELVGIGLADMVVVAMPDAVVVAPRARVQELRAAVARLKAEARPQATDFARDRRPWGWFETVATGTRHQVKRIVVRPGGVLSLQSHVHRAEHWIVVSGTARVTIGEVARLVSENESVYVPLGAVHRLENPGKVDLHVIEVQTGAYLGEDDITRHEDVYARLAAD